MGYLEKVRYLKEKEKKGDYDKDIYYIDALFPEPTKWGTGELDKIVEQYPYLPKSYLEFIKEFDDLSLSFVSFYGSKHIVTPGLNPVWNLGLADYIEELSEYTNRFKYDYFPFGKDANGSVFAFNRKKEVVYFNIDDYLFEQEPIKLANNFEEFVGECLLGNRYPEFEYIQGNTYYDFLQSLGWV
jgi:hypothetical protein